MGNIRQGKARAGGPENLEKLHHMYHRLLQQYRHQGSLVVLAGRKWKEGERRRSLDRGKHQSTMYHVPFLREEFALMVENGQCVVVLYLVDKELMGLRIVPLGVK